MRNYLFSFLFIPFLSFSQYGVLDETFGEGGILRSNVLPSDLTFANPNNILTDNNGNIYTALSTRTEGGDEGLYNRILITKFMSNGELDFSFGENGFLLLSYQNKSTYISDFILTNDDQILIVGSVTPFESAEISWAVLIKIDLNGNYINDFGENGILLIDRSSSMFGENVAEFNDGSILIGGTYTHISDTQAIFFMKFSELGELDVNYGDNGFVDTYANYYNDLLDLKIDEESYIYAVFQSVNYEESQLKSYILKYDYDDIILSTNRSDIRFNSLNFGKNGKLIVSGNIFQNEENKFFLTSYFPDFELDTEFGNNGEVITDVGELIGENSYNYSLQSLVSPVNFRIIQLGNTKIEGGTSNFTLIGNRQDGQTDNSFGSQGLTITDVNALNDDSPVDGSFWGNDRILLLEGYEYQGSTIVCYKIYEGLSINDISDNPIISLVPNPVSNSFTIRGLKGSKTEIQIFDLSGKLIRDFKSVQNNQKIELGSIAKGTYVVRINSQELSETKKLIVK